MTSILDTIDFENVPEPEILSAGEHKVRIGSAEAKQGPKAPYLALRVSSIDEPAALPVYHNVTLPDGKDEGNDQIRVQVLSALLKAFNVPLKKGGGLNVESMIGCEGWITVKHEDYQGRTQAKVDKVVRSA